MSGGGGGVCVSIRLFGRRDDDELDDLSKDPGRRCDPDEPEGRRVLSSYGVRRPEELSGGVWFSE